MPGLHPSTATCPMVSVVVPLFNEEESVAELHRRLSDAMEASDINYEFIFVDDGSSDATGEQIDELANEDDRLVVLHLSRNWGHQAAVSAGIDHARGQAVVLMDGDLQDPPEVVTQFIGVWQHGYDVVYGASPASQGEPAQEAGLRRVLSDLECDQRPGHPARQRRLLLDGPPRGRGDQALARANAIHQGSPIVRGVSSGRSALRACRPRGRSSKYSLRALVELATDGLISFSSYPLRLATRLGLATISLAFVLLAWVVFDAWFSRTGPRGWASTIVVVLFMASVQLFIQGINGEYIRLIFLEVKKPPTYIVDSSRTRADEGEPAIPRSHLGRDKVRSG